MSGTDWTAGGGTDDWFTNGFAGFGSNWSNGVPVLSSTGTQSVVISGLVDTQPVINGTEAGAPGTFYVDQQGFTGTNHLTEIQIDGQYITLTNGADLTVQGIAIGNYGGTSGVETPGGTISDLTAATGTLAAYDTNMIISATGTDALSDNDDSENFGLITADGAGNRLNVTIFPGGNAQSTHTLYNYGLIEASNGGIIDIGTAMAANGTVSALANPGWIEALGGTFITTAFIEDDANAPNGAGVPDGYIEIGNAGSAMLLGGADSKDEVLFLDGTSDTLELANNNSFQGSIAGFGGNNTIQLAGYAGGVSLSYAGSILTVSELTGGGVVTLDVGTGYNPDSFAAVQAPGGLDILNGSVVSSTIDNALFSREITTSGTVLVGETVSGTLNSVYNSAGTLIGEVGMAVLTETLANGSVVTETFAVDATGGTIGGTNDYGAGITAADSNGLYEVYLQSISSTGTGPLFTDLHLDWNSATNQALFLGEQDSHFNALVGPGLTTETLLSAGDIPCFAAGTRILTPDGDVQVEHLEVGDEVLTLRDGGDEIRSIIWTGRRTIDLARHPRPEKIMQVRILAGALGTGLPERDLLLSPDHCLFIDGHLIEAKTLVNGATIIQDDRQRSITYHHIELARHGVVLAEGVPVETYLDSLNRQMFDGAAAAMLHPDFAAASREHACAELVVDGPIVRNVRQRLLNRALALGFSTTDQTDLTVKAGIETLRPGAGSSPFHLSFELTQGCGAIELLCSAGIPAHLAADPRDRRRLGVAVTGIRLVAEAGPIEIALDDPAHRGLHDDEGTHRWTNGAARISLPPYTGPACLEIEFLGQAARWAAGPKASAIGA